MTKLPLLPYRDLKKVLEAMGFVWVRREGSHNIFRHESGRIAVLPDHGRQLIVRPLLRKILRDIGMNPGEYLRMLKEL